MKRKKKAEVLSTLKTIRDGIKSPGMSICGLVDYRVHNVHKGSIGILFSRIWVNWPKFSGSIRYPVPSPNGRPPSEEYYWAQGGTMWEGEYGKLRLELLDFLIEELEKQLQ